MKRTKTICAVLGVSLLLSIFGGMRVSFGAERNDLSAVQCLRDLGGAEVNAETDFEATLTRAQFCTVLLKYLRLDNNGMYNADNTPFIDVDPGRADFSAIRTVYDLGFIAGGENRYFYPEREITGAEMLTILTTVLGYGQEAVIKGGFPMGYITVAQDKKLLKNVTMDYQAPVNLADMYQTLFNALEVPIFAFVIDGTETRFTDEDGKNILNTYYKAEKARGKVTANQYTGLAAADSRVMKKQIAIDDKVFVCSQDFSGMLGKYVDYYISYWEDSSGVVVHISPLSQYNTETRIDAEYIESVSDRTVSYSQDENVSRIKKLTISEKADVIYNGRAYTGYGALENIMPQNGYVTGLDNNRDGEADVVFILEYENYFIDGINKTDKIVFDYDSGKQLELDNTKHTVEIFNENGDTVKFSELKTGTLISAVQSMDVGEKLVRVYISNTVISGTVTAIGEDECKIDGTAYKTAAAVQRDLKINTIGDFYIDIKGKIAVFKVTADESYAYGLVYKVIHDTDNDQVILRLFTAAETFADYILAEKVVLNKKRVRLDSSGGMHTILNMVEPKMVIRYQVNGEGKIDRIEIPAAMTEKDGTKMPANTTDYRVLYEGSSFKHRNGILDGKLIINSDTLIFSMPKTENWEDRDAFGTLTSGAFTGGSTYSKNYKAYALGEKPVNIADVMTIEDMARGSIGNNTNMVIVTAVLNGINADDDACKIIKGISSGNAAELICENEALVNDNNIMRGDIIRVGTNSAGVVNKIQKIYNAGGVSGNGAVLQPETGTCENAVSFDSEFRVVVGKVVDVKDNYMKLSIQKKSDDRLYTDETNCGISGASIIRFEADNPKSVPTSCSAGELVKGDTVVVRMNLANAKEIVILR